MGKEAFCFVNADFEKKWMSRKVALDRGPTVAGVAQRSTKEIEYLDQYFYVDQTLQPLSYWLVIHMLAQRHINKFAREYQTRVRENLFCNYKHRFSLSERNYKIDCIQ